MNLQKCKIILLILMAVVSFSCQERKITDDYKEYVPRFFDGDGIVESKSMMTKEHQKDIILVLNYYGAKWKLENGKVLVSNEIDNEILWNYTSKANDSIWIKEHQLR